MHRIHHERQHSRKGIAKKPAQGVRPLGETRATFELGHTPEATELNLIQGKSGNVSASGTLRAEHAAPHPCGRWYIQAGPLRTGILVSGGKHSIEPRVSPGWWRERPVGPR